jgi:hypothetical protein
VSVGNLQEPFDEGFGKRETLVVHRSGEDSFRKRRYEYIDWLEMLIRLGEGP